VAAVTGPEIAAIAALAFGASVVQSATGLGFGLLIIPPLVLVIGVKDAVVVSNILSTALSTLLLTRVHGAVAWRTAGTLFAAACLGMPLGLAVLVFADPRTLQVVIAIGVILFTLLLARGVRLPLEGRPGEAVAGLASGVLRTSTSMGGPPVIILLQGRRMESNRFRSTMTAFFVATGVLSVAMFLAAGRIDGQVAAEAGVALPSVIGGMFAGAAIFRRTNERVFRRAVLAVLFVSATIALAGALLA
jgi:uncharacterized membrane protein YfcA